MKIFVKAKPGAKQAQIKEVSGLFPEQDAGRGGMRQFMVAVKEPAVGGKANVAIEKALAEYFKVSPLRVRIVSGEVARTKVVEVLD